MLGKLFGPRRPTLRREDISDPQKVTEYVTWWIKNDHLVRPIVSPACNSIFDEGFVPKAGTLNNPADVNPSISTLPEWFVTKVFIDLNLLRDADEEAFRAFLDGLDAEGAKSLAIVGRMAAKYGWNAEGFVYQREIEKIPAGDERVTFKMNFLDDTVGSAELRLLAWLYGQYFGDPYQLPESRAR